MISFSLWMSSLSNSKDGFSSGESSAMGRTKLQVMVQWQWSEWSGCGCWKSAQKRLTSSSCLGSLQGKTAKESDKVG